MGILQRLFGFKKNNTDNVPTTKNADNLCGNLKSGSPLSSSNQDNGGETVSSLEIKKLLKRRSSEELRKLEFLKNFEELLKSGSPLSSSNQDNGGETVSSLEIKKLLNRRW